MKKLINILTTTANRKNKRKKRNNNFFKNNQQTSKALQLGNGPIIRRKVTSIETINYVNGDYLWNGVNGNLLSYRVNELDEFTDMMDQYRLYRITGLQLIFTKRFAFDIPLQGDDTKIASALLFNIYPGYQSAASEFRTGDSTKLVPVTFFGSKTFNVEFKNIFEVTQWKKNSESTYIGVQIAPVKTISTQTDVNIPVYDVMVHFCVEFTQPV
jgi:hypothetical protein